MLKNIFILFILLQFNYTYTQNLVPNGSFEDTVGCPDNGAQVYKCKNWYDPNGYTSDYFNECASNFYVTIPQNVFGFQYPYYGKAYCGLTTYYGSFLNYREYIATTLNKVLNKSKKYTVSLKISLSDSSNYQTKNLQIGFFSDTVGQTKAIPVPYKTYEMSNYPIFDKQNWTELKTEFTADGNEKYLMIGNFNDDNNTLYELNNTGSKNIGFDFAYYYIDSIDIIETKEESNFNANLFTPNGDEKNDLFKINVAKYCNYTFSILNRWGNIIFTTNTGNFWDGKYNGNLCSSGTYFYLIEGNDCNNNKIYEKGYVQLIYY